MVDHATVALIIGVSTLVIERLFSLLRKIKNSTCCSNNEFTMNSPLKRSK